MLTKTAFLFPGQGAQFVGMGADLAHAYREARDAFEEADEVLGFALSRLCWEGPAERLRETAVTQPAVLVASEAVRRVLARYGLAPQAVAGLSLGEYAAHVAAESLAFRDAVALVHQRGRFMEEAVPAGLGAMSVVMGLARQAVVEACRQAAAEATAAAGSGSAQAVVEAVNFNCPGQVVIAGHREPVNRAGELCLAAGAKRVAPLAVSGPFHSSLMAPARDRLAEVLDRMPLLDAALPVLANTTADYVQGAAEIRQSLLDQVARPVLWEDGMRRLLNDGYDKFIEVGPGAVLAGFMKRIEKGAAMVSVQDLPGLERLLDLKGEVC